MARSFLIGWRDGKLDIMQAGAARQPTSTIDEVVEQLQQRTHAPPPDQVHRRVFITTYQRTTQAVGDAVRGAFLSIPTGLSAGMSLLRTSSSWRITLIRLPAMCRGPGGSP
jgi:hypothetical protein